MPDDLVGEFMELHRRQKLGQLGSSELDRWQALKTELSGARTSATDPGEWRPPADREDER